MTLYLAAKSLSLVIAFGQPAPNVAGQFKSVSDSMVQLGAAAEVQGFAVQISDEGLFIIADPSNSTKATVIGKTSKGVQLVLTRISSDEVTQMSLYKAAPWQSSYGRSAKLMDSSKPFSGSVFTVLPDKIVKGEMAAGAKTGVLKPYNRYMPLSEIKFEMPDTRFGGAPVFSADGRLVGVLNAMLNPIDDVRTVKIPAKGLSEMGPASLAVAYSLAPGVLQRVVDGFNSPGHMPQHPSVGLYYANNTPMGAIVRQVTEGSPAEKAGIKVGDVIMAIDGIAVKDAVQLASKFFETSVGQKVQLQILRGTEGRSITIIVGTHQQAYGKAEAKPVGRPEGTTLAVVRF